MRGTYPEAASDENWLHDSLVSMIKTIHERQDGNHARLTWAKLIPSTLNTDQSTELRNLRGIKDRLKDYESAVGNLTILQRAEILRVLNEQNNIDALLSGQGPISSLRPAYPDVDDAVHSLFVFAFGCLTDLGIRDRQYRVIFDALDIKVCIFCGFERVMSPQESRQDQDHYLPKSRYPFAAANMKNLVPMCRCCNRDYKHDVDVLNDSQGNRRTAFNPYAANSTDIDLSRSIPFEGSDLRPAWWIDFVPASAEAETWDQVFCIRTRYSRDVLNNGFNRWLESFMKFCKRKAFPADLNDDQILDVLRNYYMETLDANPVGLDFLKPKVLEMLIHHFESGNERIKRFLRDAVVGVSIPT